MIERILKWTSSSLCSNKRSVINCHSKHLNAHNTLTGETSKEQCPNRAGYKGAKRHMGRNFAWITALVALQSIDHSFRFDIAEFLVPKSIFFNEHLVERMALGNGLSRSDTDPYISTNQRLLLISLSSKMHPNCSSWVGVEICNYLFCYVWLIS